MKMTIPQKIHAGVLPGAIVSQTPSYIAFLDHQPIAKGHVLVCPVRNVQSIFDLSPSEQIEFLRFAGDVEARIRKSFNPEGVSQIMNDGPFNELGHLHLHLIPRYPNDGFSWITPNCRHYSLSELIQIANQVEGNEQCGDRETEPSV